MAVLSRLVSFNSRFIKNGRFIKAEDQAAAMAGKQPKCRSLDSGCGWPISYCPAQAVSQPHKGLAKRMAAAVLSKPMAVVSRPAKPMAL